MAVQQHSQLHSDLERAKCQIQVLISEEDKANGELKQSLERTKQMEGKLYRLMQQVDASPDVRNVLQIDLHHIVSGSIWTCLCVLS